MGEGRYIKLPCVICGAETIYACSDCRIDTGKSVHVCATVACQEEHEKLHGKDVKSNGQVKD